MLKNKHFFFTLRPMGQKEKYGLISELKRQSFVNFMLSTGLSDNRLCVKFYGFVLNTKYLIRIFGNAFSKRYVIMFKNIFQILFFCVH